MTSVAKVKLGVTDKHPEIDTGVYYLIALFAYYQPDFELFF